MKNCEHIVFDYRNLPAAKERRIDHGLRKACRQQDARPEDRGNRVCRSVCVPIFVPPPIPAFSLLLSYFLSMPSHLYFQASFSISIHVDILCNYNVFCSHVLDTFFIFNKYFIAAQGRGFVCRLMATKSDIQHGLAGAVAMSKWCVCNRTTSV